MTTKRGELALVIAMAAIAASGATELRAQESKPAEKPAIAAPAAPAAQASNWVSRCVGEGRKGNFECSVEQTIVDTNTQQLLLSIFLRLPADTRKPAMMIQLPFGLFLPSGVNLKLGTGKPQRLDMQTCDPKGCYAGMPVSKELLGAMSNETQIEVSFDNLSKQTIRVAVPLAGFAAAYKKVE